MRSFRASCEWRLEECLVTGSSRRGLQAMASPLSSHSGDNSEEPALSRDQGSYGLIKMLPRSVRVSPFCSYVQHVYGICTSIEKAHYYIYIKQFVKKQQRGSHV